MLRRVSGGEKGGGDCRGGDEGDGSRKKEIAELRSALRCLSASWGSGGGMSRGVKSSCGTSGGGMSRGVMRSIGNGGGGGDESLGDSTGRDALCAAGTILRDELLELPAVANFIFRIGGAAAEKSAEAGATALESESCGAGRAGRGTSAPKLDCRGDEPTFTVRFEAKALMMRAD